MIELRHGRVACSFLESARLQMARESWYSKDMQNLYCFLRMVTVSYLLIARHGFSTLLTPLAHDNRLGTRLQAIQLLPFMTYTDIQVLVLQRDFVTTHPGAPRCTCDGRDR